MRFDLLPILAWKPRIGSTWEDGRGMDTPGSTERTSSPDALLQLKFIEVSCRKHIAFAGGRRGALGVDAFPGRICKVAYGESDT